MDDQQTPVQLPLFTWWADKDIWTPYKKNEELTTRKTEWDALWFIYQDAKRKEQGWNEIALSPIQERCLRLAKQTERQSHWTERERIEWVAEKMQMGYLATRAMLEDISRDIQYMTEQEERRGSPGQQTVRWIQWVLTQQHWSMIRQMRFLAGKLDMSVPDTYDMVKRYCSNGHDPDEIQNGHYIEDVHPLTGERYDG